MTFNSIRAQFSTRRRRYWSTQLIYFGAACAMLFAFLRLPTNQDWITHTVQRFYKQRQRLSEQSAVSVRQREGYGNGYIYTKLIRQQCKPTDYFLIPPQRYLIRNAHQPGIKDGYAWVYPSVLYYHLGQLVHLVEMTAPDSLVQQATYTLQAHPNQLTLLKITHQNRDSVLAEFRQYDPHFFAYTPEQAQVYYRSKP